MKIKKRYSYSMTTKKKIKRHKKRKLRVDRLLIMLAAMAVCVGMMIMAITFVGDAIYGVIQNFTSDSTTPSSQSDPKKPVVTKDSVIVLDAGHGGYDGGCEIGDYNEKTITLAIALKTGKILEDAGYTIVYTRKEDISLGEYEIEDLTNRVNIGVSAQADVFVSLHLNITEDIAERVYGFEVYQNELSKQSGELAQAVDEELSALQYSTSRGVLDGTHLHIVSENATPAILIELGFLDDDGDRVYITSIDGQNKIAQALANAIMKKYQ